MISNVSNALLELFDRQKHDLPPEQLRWLGKLAIEAEVQAAQLAESLQVLADLANDDGAVSMPCDESLALILGGLAAKAETISALIAISRESQYLADYLDKTDGHKKAN